MSSRDSWKPSASVETLRLRADIMASIREFFAARDVMEVATPALSRAGSSDLELEPVAAQVQALGAEPLYLATSPEVAMKRLLAAGCGDVYQICRVFRDGELGRWHQPEFTLLEWYRVGWNDAQLMVEVDSLLRAILEPYRPRSSTVRLSYREAFLEFLQVDPCADSLALTHRLEALGVDVPSDVAGDAVLDLALETVIAAQLDADAITFIYDYPATQAALARIKPTNPPVAARFEAFSGGLELANGYEELIDHAEQRQRFELELAARRAAGRQAPPPDESFLAALAHGLPGCAGVAIGLDRLTAVAGGLSSVSEAMSFAHTVE